MLPCLILQQKEIKYKNVIYRVSLKLIKKKLRNKNFQNSTS